MTAYHTYTDQELTTLLKRGNSVAFDQLYWKYHQPVYRNIFKLTKDPEAARDILQDVFAILWNKRDTLHDDQPVANWLFRVSFNQSVNYTKKRLKELILLRPLLEDDDVQELSELNSGDEQYQLLNRALTKLSPQKRRVFELCKLEGKTYEQTAIELNISRHTVKEYLSSAMVSVKKFINDHPGYSETALFLLLVDYLKK